MTTVTLTGTYTTHYVITAPTTVVTLTPSAVIHMTGGTGIIGYGTATHYTVINSGYIHGDSRAIALHGGVVTNTSGGTIVCTGQGVEFYNASPGTVVNYGHILTTTGNPGVDMRGGGMVTNMASGVISAAGYGVSFNAVAPGTVVNYGTITATLYDAVILGAASGSKLINSGTITSASTQSTHGGVFLSAGTNMTNTAAGVVTGTTTGSHGVVLNGSNVSVSNSGSITGGSAGVLMLVGGTLSNATSAYIGGTVDGVRTTSSGSGTIDNSGTIKGGTHSVYFHTYNPILMAEAGSKLIGPVAAGSTNFHAELLLGTTGGAGTLTGLGTGTITSASIGTFAISHFNTYVLAASGTWSLTATNTMSAGQTLDVEGRLALPGTLTIGGVPKGSGTIGVAAGVLNLGVSASAPPVIDFDGIGGGLVKLAQGGHTTYPGVSLHNFERGDTTDLTGIAHFVGDVVAYNSGTITLSNAGGTILTKVTLTKESDVIGFTALSDGASGTNIVGYGVVLNPNLIQVQVIA